MKKTALVLALGSAFAGAALAQSSVTIYGIADVGVLNAPVADGNTNTAVPGLAGTNPTAGSKKSTAVQSGQSAGSRLGFRGTEDLGNGLSAVFALEQRVEFDNAGSNNTSQTGTPAVGTGSRQFDRQIFAGLSSKDAGTLTFGRQYTPQFDIQVKTDPLAYGYAGSFTTAGFPVAANRASNSLKYVTPNFSGFQGRFLYSFGGSTLAAAGSSNNELTPNSTSNTATSTANTVDKGGDKALGLGLSYENKQLLVGYTYTQSYAGTGSGNPSLIAASAASTGGVQYYVNNVAVGGLQGYGTTSTNPTANNAAYASGDKFEKWQTLNASYDFTAAKVFFNYVSVKNSIDKNFTVVATNAPVTARGDRAIWNIGVSVPFGAHKVIGSYSRFNDKTYLDQDANLYSLNYEYALSKRTSLYAGAARIANKNSGVWGFGGAGYGAQNLSTIGGQSGTAVQLGMRHAF